MDGAGSRSHGMGWIFGGVEAGAGVEPVCEMVGVGTIISRLGVPCRVCRFRILCACTGVVFRTDCREELEDCCNCWRAAR